MISDRLETTADELDRATLAARLDRLITADAEYGRIDDQRQAVAAALARRFEPSGDGSLLLLGAGATALAVVHDRFPIRTIRAVELGSAALRRLPPLTGVESRDALLGPTSLGDATFGGVLVVDALTILPAPESWISALAGRLAPDAPIHFATDFYAENTAVHRWRRRFGLPYRLLSTEGWTTRFGAAGFESVTTSRIRLDGADAWRSLRGSLVITARRPR